MMPKFIQVWEVFQVSGDELGTHQGTLGWYTSRELAKEAVDASFKASVYAQAACTPKTAIELEGGAIYVLHNAKPVTLDKLALRAKREI
jgi:hypothetical protein